MDKLTRDKSVGWYHERPDETQLTPSARELLEKYSKISPDKVEDHVVNIHNEAWEIFPYPCIGRFAFLDLSLRKFEEYPEVLNRLRDGQRLLDLGCCFGQEIRHLVMDGAPAENIYGCDLRKEYIELGFQLFCDKDTLKSTFMAADIFDAASPLNAFKGKFDMVFAGSFFHLWGYEDQVKVSKLVVDLLRPQAGSMIFGRQVGVVDVAKQHDAMIGKMFQHNVESFKKMWKEIEEDVGVPFVADAKLEAVPPRRIPSEDGDNIRRIYFTVRRA